MTDEKEQPDDKKPDEIMDQAKRLLQERNSADAFYNLGKWIGAFIVGMAKAGCTPEQIKDSMPFIHNYLMTQTRKEQK